MDEVCNKSVKWAGRNDALAGYFDLISYNVGLNITYRASKRIISY